MMDVRPIDLNALEGLAAAVRDDPRMAECLHGALDHRYGEACGGLASGDWSRDEADLECARLDAIAGALDPDRRLSAGTYVANLARWVAAGMPEAGTPGVLEALVAPGGDAFNRA